MKRAETIPNEIIWIITKLNGCAAGVTNDRRRDWEEWAEKECYAKRFNSQLKLQGERRLRRRRSVSGDAIIALVIWCVSLSSRPSGGGNDRRDDTVKDRPRVK